MNREDYAMQIAAYYFVCIWLVIQIGVTIIYGFVQLLKKLFDRIHK